jgi:hypothetical protein
MLSQHHVMNDDLLPRAPRAAHRYRWREVCDCLELFRICGTARCRRAECCRGDPVACLRTGVRHAPEMGDFARDLLQAQDEGLDFEAAFEDALEEHQECYFAWIAGINAARSR